VPSNGDVGRREKKKDMLRDEFWGRNHSEKKRKKVWPYLAEGVAAFAAPATARKRGGCSSIVKGGEKGGEGRQAPPLGEEGGGGEGGGETVHRRKKKRFRIGCAFLEKKVPREPQASTPKKPNFWCPRVSWREKKKKKMSPVHSEKIGLAR